MRRRLPDSTINKTKERVHGGSPANEGLVWSAEDQVEVVRDHVNGMSLRQLALKYKRSDHAIASRLNHTFIRLSTPKNKENYKFPVELSDTSRSGRHYTKIDLHIMLKAWKSSYPRAATDEYVAALLFRKPEEVRQKRLALIESKRPRFDFGLPPKRESKFQRDLRLLEEAINALIGNFAKEYGLENGRTK